MTPEEKLQIIKQVGEEIINEEELVELLKTKDHPVAYDGFEPSGRIHIAQGLLRAINVNKLTGTGIKFKFWVADWFALMNNKMGGDLEKIQTVGEYFIEVWKACGMDMNNVEFLWASEHMDQEYWLTVLRIGKMNSLTRIKRCSTIMGRSGAEDLTAAQIFYPAMQATDIFKLEVDICQLGMDQRKVNVLAREMAPKLGRKKPIAVHHHMLLGLGEPKPKLDEMEVFVAEALAEANLDATWSAKWSTLQEKIKRHYSKDLDKLFASTLALVSAERAAGAASKELKERVRELQGAAFEERQMSLKMSKSNPDSAIFMTDAADLVVKKFNKAYCPEGLVADNPVLEYCKYIVFQVVPEFTIERPEKYGGNATFRTYAELEAAFVAKQVHPMDLKAATAKYINQLIEPVRQHFATDAKAKALLAKVESYAVTR